MKMQLDYLNITPPTSCRSDEFVVRSIEPSGSPPACTQTEQNLPLSLSASRVPKKFSGYFSNLDLLGSLSYPVATMMSVDVFERHFSAIANTAAALHCSICGIATKSVTSVVTHGDAVRDLHMINSLIHFPSGFPDQRSNHPVSYTHLTLTTHYSE